MWKSLSFVSKSSSTTAENSFNVIMDKLKLWELPISNCRAQSYDGCANMAGNRNGVQQKIIEENPLALFVHCCAHNLNLGLIDSCTACVEAVTFFGTLEKIYSFFTPSMVRLNSFEKACIDNDITKTFKRLQPCQ